MIETFKREESKCLSVDELHQYSSSDVDMCAFGMSDSEQWSSMALDYLNLSVLEIDAPYYVSYPAIPLDGLSTEF